MKYKGARELLIELGVGQEVEFEVGYTGTIEK